MLARQEAGRMRQGITELHDTRRIFAADDTLVPRRTLHARWLGL
jgi:hypothetical protein